MGSDGGSVPIIEMETVLGLFIVSVMGTVYRCGQLSGE